MPRGLRVGFFVGYDDAEAFKQADRRRRWESNATAQAYPTPTDSMIDEDEFGEPESLYRYHVQIQE